MSRFFPGNGKHKTGILPLKPRTLFAIPLPQTLIFCGWIEHWLDADTTEKKKHNFKINFC
jgi:hypothetical protein